MLKLVGDLPELHKLKSIVGGDMRLTEDVSLLPRKAQVALKMFELEQASFSNYEMSVTKCLTILGRNKKEYRIH